MDLVRATERSGSSAPLTWAWKVAESMYKYLQTHRILKFSNCVLVRVPINNYNYEQQITLFVILLAKKNLHESPWCNLRGSLTFKLEVLVISIVIDCDRGHCYEHFKKKKSNSNEN